MQLNKTNTSDTEESFLTLNLSIPNDVISSKIYDNDFDFGIINFPFLDGDVPRAETVSYGMHISPLIRFVI